MIFLPAGMAGWCFRSCSDPIARRSRYCWWYQDSLYHNVSRVPHQYSWSLCQVQTGAGEAQLCHTYVLSWAHPDLQNNDRPETSVSQYNHNQFWTIALISHFIISVNHIVRWSVRWSVRAQSIVNISWRPHTVASVYINYPSPAAVRCTKLRVDTRWDWRSWS